MTILASSATRMDEIAEYLGTHASIRLSQISWLAWISQQIDRGVIQLQAGLEEWLRLWEHS